MLKRVAALISFVAATAGGCRSERPKKVDTPAQARVEVLAAKLASHNVGRVEILRVPDWVLTARDFTPELLERNCDYRLTIQRLNANLYEPTLTKAIAELYVDPASDIPEMRWGVIFYDRDDHRLEGIFLSEDGKRGSIGELPVSFSRGLFNWVHTFSCCLR